MKTRAVVITLGFMILVGALLTVLIPVRTDRNVRSRGLNVYLAISDMRRFLGYYLMIARANDDRISAFDSKTYSDWLVLYEGTKHLSRADLEDFKYICAEYKFRTNPNVVQRNVSEIGDKEAVLLIDEPKFPNLQAISINGDVVLR